MLSHLTWIFPIFDSHRHRCIGIEVICNWLLLRLHWKFNYNLLFVRKYFEREHEWSVDAWKCPIQSWSCATAEQSCARNFAFNSTMTFHFSTFDCSPENWIAPKPRKQFSVWIVCADTALKWARFELYWLVSL